MEARDGMPWYLLDSTIAAFLAIGIGALGLTTAYWLHLRDRYERQSVVLDSARTMVLHEGKGELPHRVKLPLLSSGNRAAVIHDIRLVAKDGTPFLSCRQEDRCSPALPFRLDAPDEKVVVFEISDAEEQRLGRVDIEFLGGTKPIKWPYHRSLPPAGADLSLKGGVPDVTVVPSHATKRPVP